MKRDEKIVDEVGVAVWQRFGLSTCELADYVNLDVMDVAAALAWLRRAGKVSFFRGRRWRKAGAGTELFWHSIR